MKMFGMIQLRMIIVVLIAIALLVPVQGQEDGLVVEWHFDEGTGNIVKESSGNGNDGTINGATWVDGKFGKALSFSGTNNYVDIPASSINNMGAGTIALWILPSSSQGSSWYSNINGAFFGKQHNGVYNMAVIGFDKATLPARISFCLANSGGILVGTASVSPNVWHYIVVNWDGSYWKIYVDGIQDVSQANSNILIDDLSPTLTSIGAWGGDGRSFFKGLIDEVRIYNRALTPEEVKQQYESGASALSLTKTAIPQSIKQGQTTTITLTVKNTVSTEISDIEIADVIPKDLTLIDGETKKTYTSLSPQDSRQFQYSVQINEAGTFNLNPAAGTFSDAKGNYYSAKSNTAAINVIASIAGTSDPTSAGRPAAATTSLAVKKEASPYSIRQYQTTNVTIQIRNTGTSEIRDIEVVDSINSNLELSGGDFPNPKKYNSLSPGESRDIRYILKSKESGTFILNPATVSYSDNTGNIKVVKSEQISLTVIPSTEGSPEISSPSDIGTSSAVLLHGQKTDVVLGEDILLKLSAVNLITKPPMSVQVMIYPPSGMSVTGSEFVESGAGIYTTKYTLNPGDGKDIEVHIKTNQVGDFNAKGRIVYYFGEDKTKAEDHTLNLPIKVRKELGQPAPSSTDEAGMIAKTPGFEGMLAVIVLLLVLFLKRNR